MLFIADRRGGSGKALFHIEFQATSDAEMPLRNLVYAGLAARKLRGHFRNLGESRALARAFERDADPALRERIAQQLRPVLGSVYDHSLLKETSPMATMLEVFTEARDADRAIARNEGRAEGQVRTD